MKVHTKSGRENYAYERITGYQQPVDMHGRAAKIISPSQEKELTPTLALYSPDYETTVSADASSMGWEQY